MPLFHFAGNYHSRYQYCVLILVGSKYSCVPDISKLQKLVIPYINGFLALMHPYGGKELK